MCREWFSDLVRPTALLLDVSLLEKSEEDLEELECVVVAAPASFPSSRNEMSRAFRGRNVEVLLFGFWYRVVFEALMAGGEASEGHLGRTSRKDRRLLATGSRQIVREVSSPCRVVESVPRTMSVEGECREKYGAVGLECRSRARVRGLLLWDHWHVKHEDQDIVIMTSDFVGIFCNPSAFFNSEQFTLMITVRCWLYMSPISS